MGLFVDVVVYRVDGPIEIPTSAYEDLLVLKRFEISEFEFSISANGGDQFIARRYSENR